MLTWRIFPVVFGAVVILWCFKPGMTFYPRAMGIGSKDRTVPKWFGRLWFILFGSWFITMGLSNSERVDRILSVFFPVAIGMTFLCVGIWPGWMPDRSSENRGRAWSVRIIALILGTAFLYFGLSKLRH